MDKNINTSSVVILLSTYNGAEYLPEQLDSLFAQTYKDFIIIARDDGSTDNTLDILKSYDIHILDATENLGVKESFSYLLNYALSHTKSLYFMFCDQDDFWEEDKIEKTLSKMQNTCISFPKTPVLVHTDLKIVDKDMHIIHPSFWEHEFTLPQFNTFNRLLIQNTITGCTVMINRELAQKALKIPHKAIMHDWWLGLVTSYFGKIGYVEASTIRYRQHGGNTIGAKGFTPKNIIREALYLIVTIFIDKGKYIKTMQDNIDQTQAFLDTYHNEIDSNTKTMLTHFSAINEKTFIQRRVILFKHKLFKQGFIRNMGLFLKI
jgi:glycosyltransferase involved in cell wall biosynthesis